MREIGYSVLVRRGVWCRVPGDLKPDTRHPAPAFHVTLLSSPVSHQ